jgi:hypothetical protein
MDASGSMGIASLTNRPGSTRKMNRLLGAAGLAGVGLFMMTGFLASAAPITAPATLAALALTVGLPALGSAILVRGHFAEARRRGARRSLLRLQTMQAEILRLAGESGSRLTVVEVAAQLGVPPDEAREALDALMRQDQADLEITDEGLLVYTFEELRLVERKHESRRLLDG